MFAFISEQVYEGRLISHPDTANQRVTGTTLPEAGAFWVPVVHEGNEQIAQEEVAAIGRTVIELLGGSWTEKDGSTRPMREAKCNTAEQMQLVNTLCALPLQEFFFRQD